MNKLSSAHEMPRRGEASALAHDRWKRDFLRIILGGSIVILLLIVLVAVPSNTWITNLIYLLLLALMALAAFAPVSYTLQAWVLLVTFYFAGTNLLLISGVEGEAGLVYLTLLVWSALLYERPIEIITGSAITITVLIIAVLTINGYHVLSGRIGPSDPAYKILVGDWVDWLVYLVEVLGVGAILSLGIRRLKRKFDNDLAEARKFLAEQQTARLGLENRLAERSADLTSANFQAERRAGQLRSITEVTRTAFGIQNLDQLLANLTDLISRGFNYYHVGIFLLDDSGEFAVLRASNSEGGLKMLARNHHLRVGEEGLVGYVTQTQLPHITPDTTSDPIYFGNPDLTETRSEIALPLRTGAAVLGALDIQSTELNAFSQDDLATFTVLADQIAITIKNARLLTQTNRALEEVQTANSQLTGLSWRKYEDEIRVNGYRYSGLEPEPISSPLQTGGASDATLSIPLRLRGQTIGLLKLNPTEPFHVWTQDDQDIANAVADRIALALENARLLEESQRRASKERTIGEIASRIGASVNLDNILRTAIQEIGKVIPGSDVSIQLEPNRRNDNPQ